MCRMNACLTAAGFISAIAFLFLLAGLVVPLWRFDPGNTLKVFRGLWFDVSCQQNTACEIVVLDAAGTHDNSLPWVGIWIWRGILLAGTSFALLGTLIVDCCCCARERSKGCHVLACVLLWLSGLITGGFVLWLASVYSHTTTYTHAASFPWCYFCTGLGALFALIAAICLVTALCKWRRYDDYYDDRYGHDDRPIPLEQRQEWNKHGHTNASYQHSERRSHEERENVRENMGKKSTSQEYNSYDRQHYDRVAQPPPYSHNQHSGSNMYRPYTQNQGY